jgi:hypothetical protein
MIRRVLAGLLVLAALAAAPASAQITIGAGPNFGCNNNVAVNVSSSGATQLVALVSGKTIYICSFVLVAAGTVTAKFQYGTGSNCVTGTTDMTGAMSFTTNSGASEGSGVGILMQTAASNALCLTLGGAVGVQGQVSYAQQ